MAGSGEVSAEEASEKDPRWASPRLLFYALHRISDELLSELTEEVIKEIDEALGSCVQTLVDSEFHKPS